MKAKFSENWRSQNLVSARCSNPEESFVGSWVLTLRLLSPFSGLRVLFSNDSMEVKNVSIICTRANQEKFSFAVVWDTFLACG